MEEDVVYWSGLLAQRIVVAFGPVLEPTCVYGICIVRLEDGADPQVLAANDPTNRDRLRKAGVDVVDHHDMTRFHRHPERQSPLEQNLPDVLCAARATAQWVAEAISEETVCLVIRERRGNRLSIITRRAAVVGQASETCPRLFRRGSGDRTY